VSEVTRLRTIAVAAYGPTALSSIGLGAVTPVLALTARHLGADPGAAALVVGLLGVGLVLGDLPAGALTARIGERRALIGASLAEAVAFGAAGLSPTLVTLAGAVLVVGVSQSVFGLARHSFLIEVVPVPMRARALSTLGGVHRIGMLLGPFAGAAVVARWGLVAAYAAAAVTALLAMVLVASMRELPDSGLALAARGADRPDQQPQQGPSDQPDHSDQLSVGAVLRRHRRLLATLGVGVLAVAATRAARNAIVPLWAEAIGLDATATSLVFGISGVLDVLLFYPAGWVMDRHGRVAVAVPSMLVLGVGLALVPLAGSFWSLVAVASVLGVGNGIGAGILLTLGADVAPQQGRAQFLSGWRLMADVGNAAGPALVSLGTVLVSLGAAAVGLGALAWFGALWLWRWVPRRVGSPAGVSAEVSSPGESTRAP
jgi:MFS family permease